MKNARENIPCYHNVYDVLYYEILEIFDLC